MKKSEIKQILLSLQNENNIADVTFLLGKLDMLDERYIEKTLAQIGGTPENIRQYFKSAIAGMQLEHKNDNRPINEMITYHIQGENIVLHLPCDLHKVTSDIGYRKTMATVNLYLLDAIDRINQSKDGGYPDFANKKSIYMISPILIDRELRFLRDLGFETRKFSRRDLENEEFIKANPEADFAMQIFGTGKNISRAIISLDKTKTPEYRTAKQKKVTEINNMGITLENRTLLEK